LSDRLDCMQFEVAGVLHVRSMSDPVQKRSLVAVSKNTTRVNW